MHRFLLTVISLFVAAASAFMLGVQQQAQAVAANTCSSTIEDPHPSSGENGRIIHAKLRYTCGGQVTLYRWNLTLRRCNDRGEKPVQQLGGWACPRSGEFIVGPSAGRHNDPPDQKRQTKYVPEDKNDGGKGTAWWWVEGWTESQAPSWNTAGTISSNAVRRSST